MMIDHPISAELRASRTTRIWAAARYTSLCRPNLLVDRVAQSVRAAAWGGLRSQSAVVRFPAIIERFFGVIVVANGPLTKTKYLNLLKNALEFYFILS